MKHERDSFLIDFRDLQHLKAHIHHFAVSMDDVLLWTRDELARRPSRSGWMHFDFLAPRVCGYSGLVRLRPWTRGDFWARRNGRPILSHLIVAKKTATRHLCVWGYWNDESHFVIHTLYPGRVAPREVHDPETSAAEMGDAVKFWSRNALAVGPGEWDK